ncbi:MAG: tetratricopeptide repeat protein [Dysgonomonas sp.]|nr:tetratricopeptide repeat protein [Dysgonomonas sp.]
MSRYFFVITFILIAFNSFSQTYEELVNKSMDYLEAKEYEAAEETLKLAMRKEPGNEANILLLSNLGTIQRHLGKKEEALISYTSALSKYPNNTFALQNRAALFCEMDSLAAAMRDYNIILSYDEDNVEALYRRGLIYMSEKNYLAAEADFEQALDINPNYVPVQGSLAFAIKTRGDWEGAEEKYTDLIYNNKSQPDFYIHRAECYLNMKKLARAKEDLRKAEELKSQDPLLYIVRGQLNLHQFDKFAAREDFKKAQEMGADEDLVNHYLPLCK